MINKTKKPISFWGFQNNAEREKGIENLMAGTPQIWGERWSSRHRRLKDKLETSKKKKNHYIQRNTNKAFSRNLTGEVRVG